MWGWSAGFIGMMGFMALLIMMSSAWVSQKTDEIQYRWAQMGVTTAAEQLRESAIANVQTNGINVTPTAPPMPVYYPNGCNPSTAPPESPCVFTVQQHVQWGVVQPMTSNGQVIGYAYDVRISAETIKTEKDKPAAATENAAKTYVLRVYASPPTAQMDEVPATMFATATPAPNNN